MRNDLSESPEPLEIQDLDDVNLNTNLINHLQSIKTNFHTQQHNQFGMGSTQHAKTTDKKLHDRRFIKKDNFMTNKLDFNELEKDITGLK